MDQTFQKKITAMDHIKYLLLELHCTAIHMETDCSNLVDIIANLTDQPAFTSKLVSFQLLQTDFSQFSIFRISRIRNLRADSLANKVRNSHIFPYRSDSVGQSFSLEHFKSIYHLILENGRRQKKKIFYLVITIRANNISNQKPYIYIYFTITSSIHAIKTIIFHTKQIKTLCSIKSSFINITKGVLTYSSGPQEFQPNL